MTITIIHNPLLISAKALTEFIWDATKIKTVIEEDGDEGKVWDFPQTSDEDHFRHNHNEDSGGIRPAVVISGLFWIVAMFSKVGGKYQVLSYFGLVSIAFGIPPIANKAYRTACRGMIDTNVLMSLAIVGAISLGQYDEAA